MNVPADDRDEFEQLIGELASIMIRPDGLRLCEIAVKIYYLGHERGTEMAETYYFE